MFLLCGPFRLAPETPRAKNIFWPLKEEMVRDATRKMLRDAQPAASPGKRQAISFSEWATQIHYLYCTVWSILVGHIVGHRLRWEPVLPSYPSVFGWRSSFWLGRSTTMLAICIQKQNG